MAGAIEITSSGIEEAAAGEAAEEVVATPVAAPETPAPETPEVPKGAPKGLPKIVPPDPNAPTVATSGLDLDAFAREVFENGDISDASRQALAAKGVPESIVRTHVTELQDQATKIVTDLATSVGGQAQLDAMLQWGATGLSAEEITSLNKLLTSGDIGTMKLAVSGLQAQYEKIHGAEATTRITGATVPKTQGVKPFESQDEVSRAMQDPKWKTDTAYQRKVMERLEATDGILNIHVA